MPMFRSVLVRWADDLHRCHETTAALAIVDSHFVFAQGWQVRRDGQRWLRRRPDSYGDPTVALARAQRARLRSILLVSCDIDLDSGPRVDARCSHITAG